MIRPVHCPRCGALNKVEGISGGIQEVKLESKYNRGTSATCVSCDSDFIVRSKTGLLATANLFDIDVKLRVHHLSNFYRYAIPIESDSDIQFEYDLLVREGGPVEILFMTAEEFTHLRQGERFRVLEEYCKQDVIDTSDSGTLQSGKYRMVIRQNEKKGKMTFSIDMAAEK